MTPAQMAATLDEVTGYTRASFYLLFVAGLIAIGYVLLNPS